MNRFQFGTALVLLLATLTVKAQPGVPSAASDLMCPDANIFGSTLITGVCWSCMFPVYLAGVEMFDGRNSRPNGANQRATCYCDGDLSRGELPTMGFSVGAYLPSRLVEVVRKPWCFPTLFGADMGDTFLMDSALSMGGDSNQSNKGPGAKPHTFWNWHFYAFPLMEILELMDLPQCNIDNFTSFDLMFMSEAFPNWADSELAFLIQPESLLFGNPIAMAAGAADCVSASAGAPLNAMFWTAGCWGSHYASTGHTGTGEAPQTASLAKARAMFLLGRLGFLRRTIGEDAMCGGEKMPVVTKTQYKIQQIYPVPESNNNDPGTNAPPPDINTADAGEPANAPDADLSPGATQVPEVDISNVNGGCCHNYGESTFLWGEWRTRPATGQDFVYVLWRWTDCCVGILGEGG